MYLYKDLVLNWVSFFLALCLILVFNRPGMAENREPKEYIHCDVHHSACVAQLKDASLKLEITPKPVRAMEELTFRLELSGKSPDALPVIDLGMRRMKMGPNRVKLKKLAEGIYQGTGVIVRCASGRRTWYALISLPGMEETAFIFDVIY